MAIKINGADVISDDRFLSVADATINSTGAATLPVGTTAQRPVSPAAGMTRFNTDRNNVEGWDGYQWRSLSQGFCYATEVFAWGYGILGIMGDGSTSNNYSPAANIQNVDNCP